MAIHNMMTIILEIPLQRSSRSEHRGAKLLNQLAATFLFWIKHFNWICFNIFNIFNIWIFPTWSEYCQILRVITLNAAAMLARRWSTDGELVFWTQIYIHNTGCMTNGSQGVTKVEIKICVSEKSVQIKPLTKT